MRLCIKEHLAGWSAVALMGWGLWQAVLSLQNPVFDRIPATFDDIRTGRWTAEFSTQLDRQWPTRTTLIAGANAARYVLTRGAGDQVRLGRNEWLFSVEEIQHHPNHEDHAAQRLHLMAQINEWLRQQGVMLVVALVPDKARVHAQQLASGTYPTWYATRYDTLLSQAQAHGVAVVDVRRALPSEATQPWYYRTDSHWNQAGAKQAALAIAAVIAQQHALSGPATRFETRAVAQAEARVGDLLRLMGLAHAPDWARPTPDAEHTEHTEPLASTTPKSLLGNAAMPVTLVGTSYSQRANFHGHLQQALQAEVLNVAKDGAGFLSSMKDYVLNESFQTAKPQWIVWEIPERVFSAPLTTLEKESLGKAASALAVV